jgi:3-oxoacyl-[acyl-carrier protein] reductase
MNSKYVIVTGGSKGLGLSITKMLLTEYKIIVASRTISPELADLLSKNKENVFYERMDLNDSTSLHSWSNHVLKTYGMPYGLINNAAIAHDGVLGTMHESEIINLIQTNVIGTILLTKYLSRAMLTKRDGRIINISSIISNTGFNGLSVYAASKAAMNGFTKSLARELGRLGITVNAVLPGYLETEMSSGINDEMHDQIKRRSALKRLATTEEVASTVLFLLSESASGITGSLLTVDAGNTA